jgi:hypothetical protein
MDDADREAVKSQAGYMANLIRELRSMFVSKGNKIADLARQLERDNVDESDLEDVADKLRYQLEDDLEYALEEVRRACDEAEELVYGPPLEDEEEEGFSPF